MNDEQQQENEHDDTLALSFGRLCARELGSIALALLNPFTLTGAGIWAWFYFPLTGCILIGLAVAQLLSLAILRALDCMHDIDLIDGTLHHGQGMFDEQRYIEYRIPVLFFIGLMHIAGAGFGVIVHLFS